MGQTADLYSLDARKQSTPMLTEALTRIGLTDYEAKIYLALLEIGESTASAITKKLGIHIGRIYDILDTLATKGLCSCIQKNGVKYFTAAAPQQIQNLLQQKEKEIQDQQKLIESMLPKFEQIINEKKNSPHVEIYTGFEGFKTAYMKEASHYAPGKQLRVLGVKALNTYEKIINDFFIITIYPLRKNKRVKLLKLDDETARKDMNHTDDGEHKFLPLNSGVTINVIDDLTLISWSTEKTSMVITIEDKDTAQGFAKQFDHLWNIAEK